MRRPHLTRRLGLAALAALLLAGCDTWLGAEEAPPLPGKRISVLEHQASLAPEAAEEAGPVVLPRPWRNDAWPQAGGYPSHAMHHLAGDELNRLWSVDVGSGGDAERPLMLEPVVADGRVFAMDASSRVTALDAASGERLWRRNVVAEGEEAESFGGGLAHAGGTVYATTVFAEVVALDAADGSVKWRRRLSGPLRAAPTVRDGRLFAVTLANWTHALDTEDGSELWVHRGVAEGAAILGAAAPAADADSVLVAHTTGQVTALRPETGSSLWEDNLAGVRGTEGVSAITDVSGRPVLDRGMAFAVSSAELAVGIDRRSGARVWERRIGSTDNPWVAGDYLYMLTTGSELVCLERETGTIRWVTRIARWQDPEARSERIVWNGPVLVGDRLVVAGSHGLALTVSPFTGRPMGLESLPSEVLAPPVVADGTLYFLTNGGRLVAYR